jgi:thiamine biosynthesis lipoprotein
MSPEPELAVPPGMSAHRFRAMGSEVFLLLPAGRADAPAIAVEELFSTWEHVLSRFRPESELSRLNAQAGTPVAVSPILYAAVEAAREAARLTGGLFDPTLRHELVRIGYDRSFDAIGSVPPAIDSPRGGGGWRGIVVDRPAATVTLPAGCGLDFGGIAKGMAVDASLELLRDLGVESALLSAGGDLAVVGVPPGHRAWPVLVGGMPDAAVLPLARGALATSGTARRRWRQGEAVRHHLVDPGTGEPAVSGLCEVTVAGGTCRAAEVGATAAFVAGPRLGPTLLERLGLAGVLVTETGTRIRAGRWPRDDRARAA